MANAEIVKRWHDLRRTLAQIYLGFWILFALAPTIGLVYAAQGDKPLQASPLEMIFRFIAPIVVWTAGGFYAVSVLRTKDPDRSRALTWRMAGFFAAATATFLLATAAFV
jgi:uncharacterized membrane protein YhaH (DUF805 family)